MESRYLSLMAATVICLLAAGVGCSSSGDTRRDTTATRDTVTPPAPSIPPTSEPTIPADAVPFHRFVVDRKGGGPSGYEDAQEELEDEPELGTHRLVCRGVGDMSGAFAPTPHVVKDPPRLIAHADSAISMGTLKGSHTVVDGDTIYHIEWNADDLYNGKLEEVHYRSPVASSR